MRIKALALAVLGAASFSAGAQAQNVLIYEDFTLGVSAYSAAVDSLGWASTMVVDPVQFANELNSGDWTHVISAHQNTFAAAGFEDALSNWAQTNPGAPVLISDWRKNNPQPYLADLGFAYGAGENPLSVAGEAGSVLDGLGGGLASPGWGIYGYEVSGPEIIATDTPGSGFGVVAQNGTWFFNGFLSDTFADPQAGIDVVVAQLTVPAPGALALLGLAGLTARRRRR